MSNRRKVAKVLVALDEVMAVHDVRWYLFGAQAAILWGSSRFSNDVDVTVRMEPAVVAPFVETMRQHGFEPVFSDAEFISRSRVIPFKHHPTDMPLDVVLAGPGLEEDFFRRSIATKVKGRSIAVISPEDLIVTKILAGRPNDIADVIGVIDQKRATLDVERIRSTLHLLEQALSQSDLLREFEKLWSDDAITS